MHEDKNGVEGELDKNKNYLYAMMSRDEVEFIFQRAASIGKDIPPADVVVDLKIAWYGMKEFYIRDCNGYVLGFAEGNLEAMQGK